MNVRLLIGMTALVAVSGCAVVGPDYKRPDIRMAESYAFSHNNALRQAAEDEWWKSLGDPTLDRLMEAGLAQNLDLQAAQARIMAAEAVLQSAGPYAGLSGDLGLSAQRSKVGGGNWTSAVQGQFSPSFVVDLFGGQARNRERASARLMAAVYDKATVRLAMQLSVVSNYLDLRFFQSALAIQRRSVASKEEVVRNMRVRRRAGEATEVDLRRAEAELDSTRAQIPVYIAGERVARLGLSALLALQGREVDGLIGKSRGIPTPKANFNAGFPAELLRNRPDIRAAEARLAAATAEIGVQEARLYPALQIGGTITGSSTNSASIAGSLVLPLLDRPARIAQRNAAKATALEAEALWRKTVIDAMEEVQTALVRLEQADGQVSAYRKAVGTYREAKRLSQEAFDLNAVTLLDVLDTEDNLTSSELSLAQTRRNFTLSWAQLNVGIGQGWYADRPLVDTVTTEVASATTAPTE